MGRPQVTWFLFGFKKKRFGTSFSPNTNEVKAKKYGLVSEGPNTVMPCGSRKSSIDGTNRREARM